MRKTLKAFMAVFVMSILVISNVTVATLAANYDRDEKVLFLSDLLHEHSIDEPYNTIRIFVGADEALSDRISFFRASLLSDGYFDIYLDSDIGIRQATCCSNMHVITTTASIEHHWIAGGNCTRVDIERGRMCTSCGSHHGFFIAQTLSGCGATCRRRS